MKALVVAHGHPDFGPGGGEIAAYALFQALTEHPGIEEARFLARTGELRLPPGAVGRLRPGEYLIRRDIADWPLLVARPGEAPSGRDLASFLSAFRPDAVFLHHVVHLGLDVIAEIRAALPSARIVLTLHDYLGICRNQGLMLTTRAGAEGSSPSFGTLCGESGREACARCFPDEASDLHDRRLARFRSAFAGVDTFVAPSSFLAERYLRWGLDPARIHVIDNGTAPPSRPVAPPLFGETLRLGLFGQARPPKGLHLALAALHHLEPPLRRRLRLEVNASRLEAQEGWYRTLIERLAAPLREEGVLDWRGAYDRAALADRMEAVDAVVVPSLWWENAPLVIGEAFAHGRPVVGAALGGIAERVRDGVDGLLFEAGDARSLAEVLRRFLSAPDLGRHLSSALPVPPTVAASAEAYRRLARDAATPSFDAERRDGPPSGAL